MYDNEKSTLQNDWPRVSGMISDRTGQSRIDYPDGQKVERVSCDEMRNDSGNRTYSLLTHLK